MGNNEEEEEILVKYMEGYLHKKEDNNKWIEFWVVLERRYLLFHEQKPEKANINEHLIGWVDLTEDTKCILGKKRGYTFPFYLEKRRKRYLFKTPCHLSRHKWVKAIEASVLGDPPQIVPRTLTDVNRNISSKTRCKNIAQSYIVEPADDEKQSEITSDSTSNFYSDWEKPDSFVDHRDIFPENGKFSNISKSNTISAPGRTSCTYNNIKTKIFSLRILNPPLEEAVTLL